MPGTESISPDAKQLIKLSTTLLSKLLDHLKKASAKSHEHTSLVARLQSTIEDIKEASDTAEVLALTDTKRLTAYIDQFDSYLESIDDDEDGETFGSDEFNDELVELGDKIDKLHARIEQEAHSPVAATQALATLQKGLEGLGFETLFVSAFQKKPIGLRLKMRKKRKLWLRTGAGRQYRRKQMIRRKLHKRKDPKRTRLERKVHQVYKNG